MIYQWQDGNLIDSCVTHVTVSDPNNFCNTFAFPSINGIINTENGEGVENTGVIITGKDNGNLQTDINGAFEFIPVEGEGNYKVKPWKNKNIRNGINTLDIIKMQKHILGIERLNTPYKIIAADINNNKKVTASDILNLRKVILGEKESFTNNTSWKFVDANYNFVNPKYPLNEDYPQELMVEDLRENINVRFIGVKIGDIDCSAIANSRMRVKQRSAEAINLNVENEFLTKGEIVDIPVKLSQKASLLGMQFTFNFDREYLEYEAIENSEIELTDNNIGLKSIDKGMITLSWDDINGKDFDENAILFNIRFKVKKGGVLGGLIGITDDITPNMAIEEDEQIKNLVLEFRNDNNGAFVLYQNEPNPWSYTTMFRFDLPENGNVKVKITNSLGAVVDQYNIEGLKGPNKISLEKNRINQTGVLFVDFEFKGEHLVKRMIKIK